MTGIGPGATSVPKILGTILESGPVTAVGMGTGAGIAKALMMSGKVSAGLAGLIGGAIGEGSLAGMESSKEMYDTIASAPIEQLAQTDEFNQAYADLLESGLTEDEKIQEARNAVAKKPPSRPV